MKNGESITLANIRLALKNQWVENNPTNICILLLTSVFFASWYYADGFCGCLIRMLPDVRWVGFLPPPKNLAATQAYLQQCQWRRKTVYNTGTSSEPDDQGQCYITFLADQLCFDRNKVQGHFLLWFQINNLLQLTQPKLHFQVLSSQTLCLPGLGSNPWSISYFCFFSHT